jgi:hypothetical protein
MEGLGLSSAGRTSSNLGRALDDTALECRLVSGPVVRHGGLRFISGASGRSEPQARPGGLQ